MGAITFVDGVETFLSKYMVIEPWRMMAEEAALRKLGVHDAFERTLISESALVITPFHAAANRLREIARGNARHGSCGLGVGETKKDALELGDDLIVRARDLSDPKLIETFRRIQQCKREQLWKEGVMSACWNLSEAQDDIHFLLSDQVVSIFVDALTEFNSRARIVSDESLKELLAKEGTVICELSQGVLLDEWRGFHPYTTWGTSTPDQAIALLREAEYTGHVEKLGVVRAYATRHGPGPFVTEDLELTSRLPDPVSARAKWQGQFRTGWFDCVSTRYAIEACGGIDSLAVTCLDRLKDEPVWKICTDYELDVPAESPLFEQTPEATDKVRFMKLGVFQDLDHQSQLTEALLRAKPLYSLRVHDEDVTTKNAAFLLLLGILLKTKITLASYGPSATDKIFY